MKLTRRLTTTGTAAIAVSRGGNKGSCSPTRSKFKTYFERRQIVMAMLFSLCIPVVFRIKAYTSKNMNEIHEESTSLPSLSTSTTLEITSPEPTAEEPTAEEPTVEEPTVEEPTPESIGKESKLSTSPHEGEIHETGAWANCTAETSPLQHKLSMRKRRKNRRLGSETSSASSTDKEQNNEEGASRSLSSSLPTRSTTVSCHTIKYRINTEIFQNTKNIIFGVLSGAGGEGPNRRQAIRKTWGNTTQYDNSNIQQMRVFFLVAGPWDEIQNEYHTYGDLVWIEEDEVYDGEHSVLTYKSQSFIQIVYDLVMELDGIDENDIKFIFKTDDDSYIHVQNLYRELMESPTITNTTTIVTGEGTENEKFEVIPIDEPLPRDYWGWCQLRKFPPNRDSADKWSVSYDLYPEPKYPRYCQGAGFALSWKFIERAALSFPQSQIATMRYLPFEDASIGLLAERCRIIPTMVEKRKWIRMYRTNSEDERMRVKEGLPKIDKSKLTKPIMSERIVQHRIYDEWDMKEHHKIVMNLEEYDRESTVQWYDPTSESDKEKSD